MPPPSDFFLHQSLSLAEVTANMQNQETMAPPPPYSVSQPQNPAPGETQSDIDIDDNEANWDTTIPNPITIHIDASISVQGNSNTIIVTSGMGSQQPGSSPTSASASASAPSTTAPSATTSNMTSATAMLETAEKHRQAKITEMATSIIAALQSSRELSQGPNGRGAPVEININTGVRIEGSRNVICAGSGAGRVLPKKKDGQNTINNDDYNEPYEDHSDSRRKRRAQSEPIDTPKAKKEFLRSLRTN